MQSVDIRDKTDHGNGQPEYGQQHINDSLTGDGDAMTVSGGGDLSAAAGSAALSATLGVGIKEYMNVPWMPLADVEAAGPTGNSLDPSAADRREQSGRGFTNGAGRTGNNKTSSSSAVASGGGAPHPAAAAAASATSATAATAASSAASTRPADPSPEDDQFPYDEVTTAGGGRAGNGSEIREPVLRPKSRIRMYRMPDGSSAAAVPGTNGSVQSSAGQTHGNNNSNTSSSSSSVTAERSFIVHLLPQKLMNMIEQAEKYARMAFSPFMWPTKERTQRALKHFPRSVCMCVCSILFYDVKIYFIHSYANDEYSGGLCIEKYNDDNVIGTKQ